MRRVATGSKLGVEDWSGAGDRGHLSAHSGCEPQPEQRSGGVRGVEVEEWRFDYRGLAFRRAKVQSARARTENARRTT